MNTQTLDLNRMGLAPMNEFEMMEVDGGNFWDFLKTAVVIALAVFILVETGIAVAAALAI